MVSMLSLRRDAVAEQPIGAPNRLLAIVNAMEAAAETEAARLALAYKDRIEGGMKAVAGAKRRNEDERLSGWGLSRCSDDRTVAGAERRCTDELPLSKLPRRYYSAFETMGLGSQFFAS